MDIKVKQASITKIRSDLLVVNLFSEIKKPGGATAEVDKKLDGAIVDLIKSGELTGKLGEVNLIHTQGKLPATQVLVVGLGKSSEFELDKVRIAAAAAVAEAKRVKAKSVATIIHGGGVGGLEIKDAAQALVEGSLIGAYKYKGFITEKDDSFFR